MLLPNGCSSGARLRWWRFMHKPCAIAEESLLGLTGQNSTYEACEKGARFGSPCVVVAGSLVRSMPPSPVCWRAGQATVGIYFIQFGVCRAPPSKNEKSRALSIGRQTKTRERLLGHISSEVGWPPCSSRSRSRSVYCTVILQDQRGVGISSFRV